MRITYETLKSNLPRMLDVRPAFQGAYNIVDERGQGHKTLFTGTPRECYGFLCGWAQSNADELAQAVIMWANNNEKKWRDKPDDMLHALINKAAKHRTGHPYLELKPRDT